MGGGWIAAAASKAQDRSTMSGSDRKFDRLVLLTMVGILAAILVFYAAVIR